MHSGIRQRIASAAQPSADLILERRLPPIPEKRKD